VDIAESDVEHTSKNDKTSSRSETVSNNKRSKTLSSKMAKDVPSATKQNNSNNAAAKPKKFPKSYKRKKEVEEMAYSVGNDFHFVEDKGHSTLF